MGKGKKIREILKEGRIIGYRHNNLHIGGDKGAPIAAKPRAAVRDAGELPTMDVTVYFAEWDRTVPTPPPEYPPYLALHPYTAFPYYQFTGADQFAVDIPLMTVVQDLVGKALNPAISTPEPPDPPVIGTVTAVSVSSDSNAESNGQLNGVPDWLMGITITGSNGVEYEYINDDDDSYTFNPDGTITWSGTAWMYFIGTPKVPISGSDAGHSGSQGAFYPSLRLDEYPVGALPGASFTLSWEKTSFTFEVQSATEKGELVHRLIRRA